MLKVFRGAKRKKGGEITKGCTSPLSPYKGVPPPPRVRGSLKFCKTFISLYEIQIHHKNYLLQIIEGLRGKRVLGIFGLLKMLHILQAVLFRCVEQCPVYFLLKFGINLHVLVFQRAEVALAQVAHAISAFQKTKRC